VRQQPTHQLCRWDAWNETWNDLQVILFLLQEHVTTKNNTMHKPLLILKYNAVWTKKEKVSFMQNFWEIRTPLTSQTIHNATQVWRSIQHKQRKRRM
jgi:hypothetical protein